MLESKRLVIWDWNGTLLDDAPFSHRITNTILADIGQRSISYEEFQRAYQHPIEKMYHALGIQIDRSQYQRMWHLYHDRYFELLPSIPLHSDALEILSFAQSRNLRQVILSALPHTMLAHTVELHKLEPYFEHIKGIAGTGDTHKVQNGIELMETLQVDPSDTVIIGDSSHDFETAIALGIDCILISRGAEHHSKLKLLGCPVLDDFSPLFGQTPRS